MTDDTKVFAPAAPDFGGLNGRFANLYARAPASRVGAFLTIALGAVAGLVAALVVM